MKLSLEGELFVLGIMTKKEFNAIAVNISGQWLLFVLFSGRKKTDDLYFLYIFKMIG